MTKQELELDALAEIREERAALKRIKEGEKQAARDAVVARRVERGLRRTLAELRELFNRRMQLDMAQRRIAEARLLRNNTWTECKRLKAELHEAAVDARRALTECNNLERGAKRHEAFLSAEQCGFTADELDAQIKRLESRLAQN